VLRPLHRVQAQPAPAAAGGRPPGQHALKALLEDNAPYNAKVTFHPDGRAGALGATGWNAPELAPWLEGALNAASQPHFGAPVGYIGQGGTIPLMSMLQQGFPQAQMMVCGVLGPKSNAHGPNEFLHVPYGKKLTAAVAQVIACVGARRSFGVFGQEAATLV
jgi:acetylornithine deacetylase/succinyl-diaminopimelate desuccinylase-like protein